MAGRDDDRERSAGAFLGPSGTFPVPMHTLSDEIPREPDELEAERRPRGGVARRRGWRDRLARLLGRRGRET